MFFKLTLGLLISAVALTSCQNPRSQKSAATPGGPLPNPTPTTPTPFNPHPGNTIWFYATNGSSNWNSLSVFPQVRTFLSKVMGVCDREANSWGLADCQSWVSGIHQVWFELPVFQHIHQIDNGTAVLTVYVQPTVNPYAWYWGSFPSGSRLIGCFLGFCLPNPQIYANPYKQALRVRTHPQSNELIATGTPPAGTAGWQGLLAVRMWFSTNQVQITYDNQVIYEGVFTRNP